MSASVALGFTSRGSVSPSAPCRLKISSGLQMPHVPYGMQKVAALAMALPTINVGDAAIGVVTLGILILWPRLGIRLPGPPPGAAGRLCGHAGAVSLLGGDVATIGSQVPLSAGGRHSGQWHSAALLPQLVLPWDMPGSNFPP
ncbi:hypothetical protein LNP74_28550 [Klebsiella pneumoniae subsp. pneumoniae]|nr:hypothetical protein [Klebsiella pneumoniae subsp. pneumoniae]